PFFYLDNFSINRRHVDFYYRMHYTKRKNKIQPSGSPTNADYCTHFLKMSICLITGRNFMSEKTDRRVRKTRAQLRAGLATLMQKKSIKEITVKELVEEVDINRSTFY